ncbi:MAG: non-homologous end-joining DNA ligase [Gillisia sp.]
MIDILENLPEKSKEELKNEKQPDWTSPMLATLTHEVFSDKNWLFERKLDGERCLVFRKGKEVNIMSRNQKNLDVTYPEVVQAFKDQGNNDFIVDGEMVAFEGKVTSFSALQSRMHLKDPELVKQSSTKVFFYLFDILHLDGYNLTQLPLLQRKKILRRFIDFADPLRFTTHRNQKGEKYFKEACEKSWEGLIAKKADSIYKHSRSGDWLKLKCVNEQEFVIGGYTDPQGERIGFGSLLIGYYEDEKLRYAGKVGTGYNDAMLADLSEKMKKNAINSSPFENNKDLPRSKVQWTKPKFVAQVGFTEWTGSGKLRHPRFLGIREDKSPKEVVREK